MKRGLLRVWVLLSLIWIVLSAFLAGPDWVWGPYHSHPSLGDWRGYLAIIVLPPIGLLLLVGGLARAMMWVVRGFQVGDASTRRAA
ncbi:hypothetical protein [Rhodopila sp.]|uniref:hypothetical protein n=1 Tax=Rhodopila sp. TaxID=2480087 RepID=UPI003D127F64